VARGIIAQFVGRGITLATSFALLPFIVSRVGAEPYGLYLLVVSVSGYFFVLDFGVAATLIKYVAEYRGRDDTATLHRIANAAFTFYVGVGAVAALGLGVAAVFADRLFGLDPAHVDTARQLLLVAAVAALATWPTTVFRGMAEGFQRYDVTARVDTIVQLVRAGLIVAALPLGAGVVTLLVLLYASTLVINLACYGAVRRWDPGFILVFPARDASTFRRIFGFAAYIFAGSVASLVIFQLDYFVIGRLVSVAAITAFGVAATLHGAMKTIDNLLSAPPWAAGAELEGRADHARQRELFLRGTRYLALFFAPVVAIAVVFAGPIIRFWMGGHFEESVMPARILLASWILVALWETGTGLLTARGILRVPLVLALIQAALHLGLAVSLAGPLGLSGVALATLLPVVVMWTPVMRYILRRLEVRARVFFRQALLPALLPLAAAPLLAVILLSAWYPSNLAWTIVQMLVVYAAVLALTYVIALDEEDRDLLRHVPQLCVTLLRRG
jgi:O-antigen/teichoic acid export membrane protein